MKIKTIAFLQFLLFVFASTAQSESNGTTAITAIHQKDGMVEITVTCSKHLKTGANPYVLHIDDRVFTRSNSSKDDRTGRTLIFYIPEADFNQLADGANVTMVYGYDKKEEGAEKNDRASKEYHGKQWQVGKLNKQMLNK